MKSDVYDYRVWFWGECGLEDSFADTVSEKDRFLLFPCRSLLGSPLYVVLADCNVANNTSVEVVQAIPAQNITRCIPQMCRVINKYHWKSRPTDEMLLLFTKGKTIVASPLKRITKI